MPRMLNTSIGYNPAFLSSVAQEMLLPMTPKTQAGPSVVIGVTGVTGKRELSSSRVGVQCSEPIMGCLL